MSPHHLGQALMMFEATTGHSCLLIACRCCGRTHVARPQESITARAGSSRVADEPGEAIDAVRMSPAGDLSPHHFGQPAGDVQGHMMDGTFDPALIVRTSTLACRSLDRVGLSSTERLIARRMARMIEAGGVLLPNFLSSNVIRVIRM
jgi:hypothetical protein